MRPRPVATLVVTDGNGLFGLAPPFDHYVISSPSLWWDAHSMLGRARSQRRLQRAGGPCRVLFGVGAEETDVGRRREAANLPDGHSGKPPGTALDMVDDLLRFIDLLHLDEWPGFAVRSVVLPDEFHATVPGAVLTRGLRHVFCPP